MIALQFVTADGGRSWTLFKVLHAQNVDLPPGVPFGSVGNGKVPTGGRVAPSVGRKLRIYCERALPSGGNLPIVTRLVEGSLADSAGWQVGDTIVSVDTVPVETLTDVILATQKGTPKKTYGLRREEQLLDSTIDFDVPADQNSNGITA